MNKSESIAELSAALAKAQGEFAAIPKNRAVKIQMKSGGSFNFKYADLEATINATRPALSKNGLSIIQPICDDKLLTIITHSSGQYIESSMPLPVQIGDDPKQYGAKISYLRRYAYQALVCVMADDDLDEDGNGIDNNGYGHAPQIQQAAPKPQAKPEISSGRLAKAIEAIQSGKATKESVINNFTLTDAQHAAIMEA